jgi:predicted RNA-binding protein YlxR (DUF448 family)
MPKQRREPVRTCVACRQEGGKRTLMRLVRRADGSASLDRTGRAAGRGAYLHHDLACIEAARKRRQIERALNATVGLELWSEIAAQA